MISGKQIQDYLRSSSRFLDAEYWGTDEAIREAAGDVQVFWGDGIVTVRQLHAEIESTFAGCTFGCVPEAAEAAEARECFRIAEQLDATASRALLTYSGFLGIDLEAWEDDAACALHEAHRALYGNPWEC